MTKKIILLVAVLLFCTTPRSIPAQEQRQSDFSERQWPVVCTRNHAAMAEFLAKYRELPQFRGDVTNSETKESRARITVMVNDDTKTWSVIVHNKGGVCLLSSGENFSVITVQQALSRP